MTTTVTTKLEAINVMLTAIGESPVNTITSSTTTDVSIAIQILDNVSREVQSVGWHFNTDTNYLLCLLYTSPSPRDLSTSRMPSSA